MEDTKIENSKTENTKTETTIKAPLEVKKQEILMIPIEQINILNPRVRNQKIFSGIKQNLNMVGLKKPITVTKIKNTNVDTNAKHKYDLVCGQGRLEAFIANGQKFIPAIISDASEEDALIMSLVENLARRQHRAIDLMQGVEALQKKGYDCTEIAEKTGLSKDYVKDVIFLLDKGEQRLLVAVENGQIPITIAVQIASTSVEDGQKALQDAYENNLLRGKKFFFASKLLEVRKRRGKAIYAKRSGLNSEQKVSANSIVEIYQREAEKRKVFTRKAEFVNNKITFLVQVFKILFKEQEFCDVLKSEKLDTIPKQLKELL
jgi:ParB family chromosome partitioning protein